MKRTTIYKILIWAVVLYFVGNNMNQNIIIANGCRMPVMSEQVWEDETHFTYAPYQRNFVTLWQFTDIYRIHLPWEDFYRILSLGDIIHLIGRLLFFYSLFLFWKHRGKKDE